MSVPKKQKLNDEEMISVLNNLSETDSVSEIDDSDNDSSESLESCDVSSDDDAIALPSDWSTQGCERDPFNLVAKVVYSLPYIIQGADKVLGQNIILNLITLKHMH